MSKYDYYYPLFKHFMVGELPDDLQVQIGEHRFIQNQSDNPSDMNSFQKFLLKEHGLEFKFSHLFNPHDIFSIVKLKDDSSLTENFRIFFHAKRRHFVDKLHSLILVTLCCAAVVTVTVVLCNCHEKDNAHELAVHKQMLEKGFSEKDMESWDFHQVIMEKAKR